MKRIVTAFVLLFVIACSSNNVPPAATVSLPSPSPGTIRGVVHTPDGSPLPGVTVTLGGPAGKRTEVTDANGAFTFGGVASGAYEIVSELSGFGRTLRKVNVTAAGTSVAITLNTSVSEAITVTAAASRLFVGSSRTKSVSYDRILEVPKNTATYAHFDDHGFIDTKQERVTTFAIDVDRASYANVRRFLNDGLVPPPDAVRIEEMINYFSYRYPQPADDAPFSITTEVAGCPWNVQHRLVRIGIQGRNLDQWKMAPNNLVFLIDVSGSMSPPARLPLIQSAFRLLVEELRAEDRVAIVVYAGAAGLVLPSTSGADKTTIRDAINRLQAGGSTAGGAGIELAYKVARDNFLRDGNNRVILATDGDFNVGVSSFHDLERLIEEKRKSGVHLSVIGVGDSNYQDANLELLADKGNGNYAYLDSLKEAEKVFRKELTGTLVTIAKDVKVQLEFDPAYVASYRQIGYENRALANKDFDDDTKDAGELGAGHSVTALYEIVPASAARGSIASLKLRYKEPKGESSRLITAGIVDEGKSAYEASADTQFAAAIAEFGMLLRNSPHKGTSSWDDILQLARIAQGEDLEGFREEFLRMVDSARAKTGPRVAAQ